MSQSRFVLKQIPVRGSGASDLTRYVARSKLDHEREGLAARPLFTAQDDELSTPAARRWLSIVGDSWDKQDALHYVLSFASAREYELLGDAEAERRQVVADFLRQALQESLARLGLAEMRWAAGVHRNTDNPHLHLLLNRHALRSDTSALVQVARLPVPLIAHHTRPPDGSRVFDYGAIINQFAAQTDARHRERARFLHYQAPLPSVPLTRALLAPETLHVRPPNAAESLAGEWLLAEIAAFQPHRPAPPVSPADIVSLPSVIAVHGLPEARDLPTLRSQVARLDHLAALQGQPPVPAFVPAEALRELLVNPPPGARLTPVAHAPQRAVEHDLPLSAPIRTAGPRR